MHDLVSVSNSTPHHEWHHSESNPTPHTPTRCIAIRRTKCESSVSPKRLGVSRERSAKSTYALQRGMLPYIAFRQLQQHRLKGNSVSCSTLYCSSSTVASKPRTKALKSVVNTTTQSAFSQRVPVAVLIGYSGKNMYVVVMPRPH